MKNTETSSKLSLIASMVIFGTIGIFRKYIPYASSVVAFFRGAIGALFLAVVILLRRERIDIGAVKKNLALLCISGAFIGINWMLLFEAYRYTSVSTATLCYYTAPIFVVIASPLVLKERITLKKAVCALVAILGMIIISGVFTDSGADLRGVLFGLGAALFYAAVVLMNKFIKGISDYEKTLIQLGSAAIIILPYMLLTENMGELSLQISSILLLAFVGILHTGVAYALYFGSIGRISAQTAAIFSYIDPVVALILSALVLRESFGMTELLGSAMILGAAIICELPPISRKKSDNIENNIEKNS